MVRREIATFLTDIYIDALKRYRRSLNINGHSLNRNSHSLNRNSHNLNINSQSLNINSQSLNINSQSLNINSGYLISVEMDTILRRSDLKQVMQPLCTSTEVITKIIYGDLLLYFGLGLARSMYDDRLMS